MINVMNELEQIEEKNKTDDLNVSLKNIKALWEKLPEPKEDTLNAYLIIEYACSICLEMDNIDEAMRWARLGSQFNKSRGDIGESEFLLGKIHFFNKQFEDAKRLFLIANKKSKGRAFIGENPEFKKLLKN